ncbi:hypothetical protein [Piscicoccus intestinalis]|uniref:hypothetical protein n=1 Tax=Piscicoccus intestinalis TaxID=746033 RepID=UPI000838BC26|nr:hypothetical protein [Piscicoccus intestinalis]
MDVLIQTFTVAFIAMIVSLVVAVVIKVIDALLGRERPAAATPAPAAEVPAAAPGEGFLPAHHVAAIAAAVSAVFDEPQIVHIEPAHQGSGWTSEARAAHRGSHNAGPSAR